LQTAHGEFEVGVADAKSKGRVFRTSRTAAINVHSLSRLDHMCGVFVGVSNVFLIRPQQSTAAALLR
jgi:hypothetical protein